MKTAISLPDTLYEAAEHLAARLGISSSELVRRAMEKFMRDYDEQCITESLNTLYAHESSALDQELVQLQSMSLPRDEW